MVMPGQTALAAASNTSLATCHHKYQKEVRRGRQVVGWGDDDEGGELTLQVLRKRAICSADFTCRCPQQCVWSVKTARVLGP